MAPGPTGCAPVSRESFLLANVLLFSVATASVLLATLYPMALDALQLGKISVGPPYFEAVLAPLIAPAVFLMGAAPLAHWRHAQALELTHRLRWAGLASLGAAVVALVMGRTGALAGLGYFLATWVVATTLAAVWQQRGQRRPLSSWGMQLAHLGVGVFILGVTTVKAFEVEREVPMQPGQQARVGAYTLRFDSIEPFQAANHRGMRAQLVLLQDGRPVAELRPESRNYTAQEMTVSAPAIDSTAWRDIYVALGERVGTEAWGVRLQYKPMILWLWAGFMMMGAGAVLSACDRRYRRPVPSAMPQRLHPAAEEGPA